MKKRKSHPKKFYVLYDGRAIEDTEDAQVFDTADSEEEAREASSTAWDGYEGVWWEYDVAKDGHTLTNERCRPDLSK